MKLNRFLKWAIVVVTFSAVPFLIRFLIYTIFKSVTVSYIMNELDMASFGLAMIVANLNELEGDIVFTEYQKSSFRLVNYLLVMVFAMLIAFAFYSDISDENRIDKFVIFKWSFGLSLVSLVVSYSIFFRKSI